MSAREALRAAPASHKPQKQQNSATTRPDQRRDTSPTSPARSPQKSAKPPQKPGSARPPRRGAPVAVDFCGTSADFCGGGPQHPNTSRQSTSSGPSADSAVSAAGGRTHRAEGSTVRQSAQGIDPWLALLTVEAPGGHVLPSENGGKA